MLPRARVSLASLTQMTELTFSDSSVARGANPSATRLAGSPATSAVCSTASTKIWAPTTMSASASNAWPTTVHDGGAELRRHSVSLSDTSSERRSRVERPAHVEGVGHDQQQRQRHLQGVEKLEDPDRGGHGEEEEEEGYVPSDGVRVDVHALAWRLAPGKLGRRRPPCNVSPIPAPCGCGT